MRYNIGAIPHTTANFGRYDQSHINKLINEPYLHYERAVPV